MKISVVEQDGKQYGEGPAGEPLMHTEADVREAIGFCFENRIERLLLYPDKFPEGFFDLSSGTAGMVLQKFRNYEIRVAAVLSLEAVPHGRRFGDMVVEENRGRYFHVTADKNEAVTWLLNQ